MSPAAAIDSADPAIPEIGQLVPVRGRHWAVSDIVDPLSLRLGLRGDFDDERVQKALDEMRGMLPGRNDPWVRA